MKILVVDDNSSDRKILRYYLEQHGCEIVEAPDGEEGLQAARRHLPDLIISDALMPKVDGFRFLRKIKSDLQLRAIPFVFYSSVYTGARDERLATALGADAFIVKPKEPEELWRELSAVLEKGEPARGKIERDLLEEEEEYLKQYTLIVTAKIEEKIRELEKANADIRLRARSYRNFFNSIRDVIVVTDDNRNILDANQPALRNIFGYELEELAGRNALLIYADEESYTTAGKEIAKHGESGRCRILELNFRKKNGETFIGELCALKRIDEEGVPSGYIGMIRDISKRKLAEEALRRSEETRFQLQAELACAAEVQTKLLPSSYPDIPGFEIAARCQPAHEVGGDFYDWTEIGPGNVAITLGDVMGNGMRAAMLMATVRATVRAATLQHGPAATLRLADLALRHDLESSESFVTIFHARLDAVNRTLTYVDCGHGYVFLRRADGAVEELHPRGLPLGVPSKEECREGMISFEPGDALVLYSDGLIDARPELALDSQVLAANLEGAGGADEMAGRLAALPALTGPPPDDITVLVVRCTT